MVLRGHRVAVGTKDISNFWEKVESSGLLTLLCETSKYEKKGKIPLSTI